MIQADPAQFNMEAFQTIFEASASERLQVFLQSVGALKRVELMPKLFEDSTHTLFKLWFVDSDKAYVCKLCVVDKLCAGDEFPQFWQQMWQIFHLSPCSSLHMLETNRSFLNAAGKYQIPDAFFESVHFPQLTVNLVVSEYIEGQNCQSNIINPKKFSILSQHLLSMHSCCFAHEGSLAQTFSCGKCTGQISPTWWQTISKVIQTLPAGSVSEKDKNQVLKQIESVKDHKVRFVPQVVDFRWDQVRRRQNSGLDEYFLIDLDALVVAPIEFDWLMLELVLNSEALDCVIAEYLGERSIPNLEPYRLIYRMVLFSMNILGDEYSWQEFKFLPVRI